jgi:anthranilate/para-aminobenzoate synthase component I
MVEHGDLESPSFLLESVVNGDQQGRYSFVGAMPALEVVAKGHQVRQGRHTRPGGDMFLRAGCCSHAQQADGSAVLYGYCKQCAAKWRDHVGRRHW